MVRVKRGIVPRLRLGLGLRLLAIRGLLLLR